MGAASDEQQHPGNQQQQQQQQVVTRSAAKRAASEGTASGQVHHTLLESPPPGEQVSRRGRAMLLAALNPLWATLAGWVAACVCLWLVVGVSERVLEPISRRTCNLPYILWLCATCVTLVLPLIAAQPLLPNGLQPLLVHGFSRNMLGVFLAANLMTGSINLGMDTLAVPDTQARAIVALYMLANCLLAVELDVRGITLKI
jgi:phosphatidylinositol glycan class W